MIRGLCKALAALLGLPLSLCGFFGFWWGLYRCAQGAFETGIALSLASIASLALGTALGKFSRGDYD